MRVLAYLPIFFYSVMNHVLHALQTVIRSYTTTLQFIDRRYFVEVEQEKCQ